MEFFIKAILLIILLFLAVIGLATIEFLLTATQMDEDGIEDNNDNTK